MPARERDAEANPAHLNDIPAFGVIFPLRFPKGGVPCGQGAACSEIFRFPQLVPGCILFFISATLVVPARMAAGVPGT